MTTTQKLLLLGLALVILALLDATVYFFAENAAGYSPTVLEALAARLPIWATDLIFLPLVYIAAAGFMRNRDDLRQEIPVAVVWIVFIAFLKVLLGSVYFQFARTGFTSIGQMTPVFARHLALHYFSSLIITILLFGVCVFISRKPPESEHSNNSWDTARDTAWLTADRVLIKSKNRSVFVKVEDIEWIESAGNYVTIHTIDGEYLLRRSMQQMEASLDGSTFFRAHRTIIVNPGKVREVRQLEGEQAVIALNNGVELKISRANIEKLELLLNIESRS